MSRARGSAIWPAVGVLLFIAGAASGATGTPGNLLAELKAGAVDWAGPARLDGAISILSHMGMTPSYSSLPFEISASEMTLEYDWRTADCLPACRVNDRDTEQFPYGAVAVSGGIPRDGHKFLLREYPAHAAPRFSVEADSGTLTATTPPELAVQYDIGVANRPFNVSVPPGGMRLSSLAPGTRVAVEGPFELVLWDWDVRVIASGTEKDFWSGDRKSPYLPDPTGLSGTAAYRVESRLMFLKVAEGTMWLTWFGGADSEFWAHDNVLSLEGDFSVHNARGRLLAAPDEVSPAEVSLEGSLDARLPAATPKALDVTVYGRASALTGDGQAYNLDDAPSWRIPPWPWMVGAAALAVPAWWAGKRWRHNLHQRWMEELEESMAAGDLDFAARRGYQLRHSKDFSVDALSMRVVALSRLGKTEEAFEAVRSQPRWPDDQGALHDYLMAYIHASRHETEEAKARLKECLQKGPSLEVQARQDPLLAGLLEPGLASRPANRAGPEAYA